MHRFKPIWGLLSLTAFCACQFNQPTSKGHFSVAIQWPQSGFQTLVIPADTQQMQIRVRDQQSLVIDERIARDQNNNPKRQYTLSTGPKDVEIQALDANGQIIAESKSQVTILAGQTTRAEMVLTPTPQPTPVPPVPSLNPDTSGTQPTPNSSSNPQSSPAPQSSPSSPASPQASANPQPSSSPGSPLTSGDSGGNSTSTRPTLTSLSADPNPLPGGGFTAQLDAVISDPDSVLQASHYKWSCTDAANQACVTPTLSSQDPKVAYWQAPSPANNGPYILTLTLDTGLHATSQQSISVSVLQGSQNVTFDDADFSNGG